MRGLGFILVMLGLALGGYFVARNMNALTENENDRTIVKPMEMAKDVAGRANQTLDRLQESLEEAEK